MRKYLIMMAAAIAAGCASDPATMSPSPSTSSPPPAQAPAPPPKVNLSGYSPAFRAGYGDGCGAVDSTRRRDEARFKSDKDYAQGWKDGYDICRRRK